MLRGFALHAVDCISIACRRTIQGLLLRVAENAWRILSMNSVLTSVLSKTKLQRDRNNGSRLQSGIIYCSRKRQRESVAYTFQHFGVNDTCCYNFKGPLDTTRVANVSRIHSRLIYQFLRRDQNRLRFIFKCECGVSMLLAAVRYLCFTIWGHVCS